MSTDRVMQNGKKSIFKINEKFKPCHNRIVISLLYHTLHRKNNKSTQELMGRFSTKVAKWQYREYENMTGYLWNSSLVGLMMME